MKEFNYKGKSLEKRFDEYFKVFSGVDFHLSNSSSLAITGPNGSGKSTLLKIMAGVLSKTSGELTFKINGDNLRNNELHRHFSFVAPYLNIYEEFTPLELIKLYCKFKRRSFYEHRFNNLLDIFKLKKRQNEQINSFSSGMKQRMKYILAFHHQNEIILLDEPFTNLDIHGIDILKEMIHESNKNGSAIVIASNDDREIELCSNILDLGK